MHWPFEEVSSRASLWGWKRALLALQICPRMTIFNAVTRCEQKKNFKSAPDSGTKSAALSGYSLVAKRKLPKL